MKIHRNLLWVQFSEEKRDQLRSDRTLSRLLLVEPTPGLFAVRLADREKLLERLEKLGVPPKLEGSRS